MKLRSWISKLSPAAVGLGFGVMAVPLVFQNCGQAGLDGDTEFASTSSSAEIKKFQAAPFPFDVSMNQISVMTCPASKTTTNNPEDTDNPIYTARVGAFDNRTLALRYPFAFPDAAGLTDTERSERLNAGVGIKKEFVAYIKDSFKERIAAKPDPAMELKVMSRKAIQNNFKYHLANAFIKRQRDRLTSLTYNNEDLIKPMFGALNSDNVLNQMLGTALRPDRGYDRLNYLAASDDVSERTMTSSLGFIKTEARLDDVRLQFENDSQIQIGFTNVDGGESPGDLLSPTDNILKDLYGKAYRLSYGGTWPGKKDLIYTSATTTQYNSDGRQGSFPINVEEYDTAKGGKPGTLMAGQGWSCFSLMVVRDVDRIDPRNQSFFNPDSDGSLWSTVNGNPVKNKYYDFQQTTTSAIVRGVRAACPPQQVGSGAPGTLNYAGGNDEWGKARLHLEVAQRFLNASDWEINTNPEYMCAVPRRATSSSQCYASGDADSSKYIRYTPVSSNAGDYGCGPGNAECAAYIHICYRTN